MTEPGQPTWVLDHTALVALFDGSPVPFGLWTDAEQGRATAIFPAAALAEAAHLASTRESAWEALLREVPGVLVTSLSEPTALASAHMPGPLVVRQVVWEAQASGGVIVTRAPWQYPTGRVAVRTF